MPESVENLLSPERLMQAQKLGQAVVSEVSRVFIGNPTIVEALLLGLLSRGHVLLEGVPGVAKTTLVKAFAQVLGCQFRRIQFTPDLLPSDITGTYILDPASKDFVLREGPIFAQIILGDEINRAPPKTQSALLEAMQEGQVTLEGQTRPLPQPFMVLATQNPIEHEGTYPLPEAQLDRFLLKLSVGYPDAAAEKNMLRAYARPPATPRELLSPPVILELQRLAAAVHVDEEIYDYVLELVRFTRQHRFVALGASPRSSLALLHAARARALLSGRDFVLPDDVKSLSPSILSHRLMLISEAEMEGIRPDRVIAEALQAVAVRPSERRRGEAGAVPGAPRRSG
ncbi:MAG TPA: MoxR family ATPase [Pseudomonadota bacterium]|nr:MoxR family ATPase [Pseudomonadota bacterium]